MGVSHSQSVSRSNLSVGQEVSIAGPDVPETGQDYPEAGLPDLQRSLEEVQGGYSPSEYLVVIPSIRPVNPDYLENVKGLDIAICDDSDGKVDRSYIHEERYRDDGFENIIHLDGRDIPAYVPPGKDHLFARHCPSIKSLGLYYAWKEGYKAVILLDDDVDTRVVRPEDFLTVRKPRSCIRYLTPSSWVNTIDLLWAATRGIYARGYPYEFRGEAVEMSNWYEEIRPYFNEGLWMGTPDINGVDKLEMMREIVLDPAHDEGAPWYIDPERAEPIHNVILGIGQNLPFSIMNAQMDASLIPAFYQPYDYPMYRSYKIRRHDDVWSCYFLKRVMDYLDLPMTCGQPVLWHRKAGDPITEVLSEHHTNLIQPVLTQMIDFAHEQMSEIQIEGNVAEIAKILARFCLINIPHYGPWSAVLADYFKRCREWAELFE